jgi:hypothetical protein
MAKVKRNLTVGTSGIFQIISIESRRAAFSFRGWTNDSSNVQREYVQVEIGNNSSIEIAIVRKMIELIRRYYQGNFNWESQRLDRTVVLSARLEDNEGLEAFLLKEFFGEALRGQPLSVMRLPAPRRVTDAEPRENRKGACAPFPSIPEQGAFA